jgi:hypothetical protein
MRVAEGDPNTSLWFQRPTGGEHLRRYHRRPNSANTYFTSVLDPLLHSRQPLHHRGYLDAATSERPIFAPWEAAAGISEQDSFWYGAKPAAAMGCPLDHPEGRSGLWPRLSSSQDRIAAPRSLAGRQR